MPEFWIPAPRTLAAVAADGDKWGARSAITKRAHAGLLRARARLFVSERGQAEFAQVPKEFWWAEGHEALEQDWERGDFSTWIDQTLQLRAYGVDFDFDGLRDMLMPESSFELARNLSVVGDPGWLSATAALRVMYEQFGTNPTAAGSALVDQCKLGFVPSRAALMQKSSSGFTSWSLEEREWDIPDWFWENLTKPEHSSQDWHRGTFRGWGRAPDRSAYMQLTNVHFLKAALDALASPSEQSLPEAKANRGGRPPKDYWDDLWCAIWGLAYRGDLQPKNQADIERAMMAWIEERGETASESTIKPLARKMFMEMQR